MKDTTMNPFQMNASSSDMGTQMKAKPNHPARRYGTDGAMPFPTGMMPPRFMNITQNEAKQRVELHLRGQFDDPVLSTHEITELYELAETYPILMVYVNSVGGRVDMFLELLNVARKFKHVCTVAAGQVASAGFMMWCIGDVRVVQDHAEFMAHRESYLSAGKTDQHVDLGQHNAKRFDRLLRDVASDVLTEEEMNTARYTEVWLTDLDMLERGKAMKWDEFIERDRTKVDVCNIMIHEDQTYLVTAAGVCIKAHLAIDEEQTISPFDLIYGERPEVEAEEVSDEADEADESPVEEEVPSMVDTLSHLIGEDIGEAQLMSRASIVVPVDMSVLLSGYAGPNLYEQLSEIICDPKMEEPNKVRYQVKRALRENLLPDGAQMIRKNGQVILYLGGTDAAVIVGNFIKNVMY